MRLRDRMRVLIGGIGYRWQRDASFGLVASDALAELDWPAHVDVEDLGYGALYVARDIADADPSYDRVILLTGIQRGRAPGELYRRRWDGALPDEAEIQERIREAGGGVVHIDHVLIVAEYFEALPDDVLVIELEPVDANGGEALSAQAERRLEEAIDLVRGEVLGPSARETPTAPAGGTSRG